MMLLNHQTLNYKLRYKNSTVAESVGLNFKSNKVWCDHFVKFKPLVKDNFSPIALKLWSSIWYL